MTTEQARTREIVQDTLIVKGKVSGLLVVSSNHLHHLSNNLKSGGVSQDVGLLPGLHRNTFLNRARGLRH